MAGPCWSFEPQDDSMGLWNRIAGVFAGKSGTGSDDPVGSELWGSNFGGGWSSSGIPVNSISAMQQVAVMACTSILAEDVAKLPLQLWERQPDGGKKLAQGHWFSGLLKRPNPWQTRFEFIEMLQASLVLRGNAYAVIVRDDRGRPTTLVPIHADRVTLYEAPSGDIFYFVTRQGLHDMAVLKDLPIMIHSEDMLHVRWLSNWYSLLGSSRIGLMREAVGLAMAQEQHAGNFARQAARPSGVLQTEAKLSKETIDHLKDQFDRDAAGFRNSGKTRVLEQGLKWQQMGMSMVDAEFMEQRRFSVEDIARGFRVPLYKIGVPSEGQGTALIQQDQEYLNNVVLGYCGRWTQKLEATFGLDGESLFLEFDTAHFLKADIATRYTAYRQATGGPFMKPNEARRAEGLPDAEGGDVVLQAINMAPLGTPPPDKSGGSGPGSDQTGGTGSGGDGDPDREPEGDAPGT
jgi:HK97 family phage portal protein